MAAWWGGVSGADSGFSGRSSDGDFTEEGAQPAEAPCCHGVQGCCTHGRPGAVLCARATPRRPSSTTAMTGVPQLPEAILLSLATQGF